MKKSFKTFWLNLVLGKGKTKSLQMMLLAICLNGLIQSQQLQEPAQPETPKSEAQQPAP